MRLGSFGCGCAERKEIMFAAGRLGLPEAAILATALVAIVIAYQIRPTGVPS